MIDGILHHENPCHPGGRIVVPSSLRKQVLKEVHGGRFSGHFAWRKTYYTLRKRYWWKGICGDVERFCRSWLECASRRRSGRAIRPPLTNIPVGGPVHMVGVDALQLPVTELRVLPQYSHIPTQNMPQNYYATILAKYFDQALGILL